MPISKLVSSLWSTSPVPMKRIPQPVPDPENPTHFKSVNETPSTTEKGNLECQMIFNHV